MQEVGGGDVVGSWLEGEREGGGTEWNEVKQHQGSRPATVLGSHWSMRG
jgi:hypothetical protein